METSLKEKYKRVQGTFHLHKKAMNMNSGIASASEVVLVVFVCIFPDTHKHNGFSRSRPRVH